VKLHFKLKDRTVASAWEKRTLRLWGKTQAGETVTVEMSRSDAMYLVVWAMKGILDKLVKE
jgi:hypothetical protein